MDVNVHYKLSKGNMKAFRELCGQDLRRAWFICYHITKEPSRAAALLLAGWKAAVEKAVQSDVAPKEGFNALFAEELLKLNTDKVEIDETYKQAKAPELPEEYRPFVDAIDHLEDDERGMYLLSVFGGLHVSKIADKLGKTSEEMKKQISDLELKATSTPEIKKLGMRKSIPLSANLKSTNGQAFDDIEVPQFLIMSLEHDYQITMKKLGKTTTAQAVGKESKTMQKTSTVKKTGNRSGFKYKKVIIVTAVILVVVLAAVFVLPRLLRGSTASTRIVTYNVDEVTYGNVTSTISGSGTLTPITRKTLTASRPGEVTEVNFTVGDEVAEDDVIAVITDIDGNEEEIVAPCDGILIELPVTDGQEIDMGGSIAMVMGKDGFTMSISVDELNISTVAMGQEVNFSIDAVDGDYTGTVTSISYNGSTNGSVTAYQIVATLEYIEGVYPGMSASAEIVIEDSGEGLLVPVDAVRTSGDDNYVYLAPIGAEVGTEYDEDELELSELTKITVESGMSDGTYILIGSDELSEGDLIVITEITSTLTGSDSETSGMSGFGGGMGFGDFENFDPGNMPQGGGFPGGY